MSVNPGVAQAAELGAHDFVLHNRIRSEVEWHDHAGHSVLLNAQLADIEIVYYVLRADQQIHFVIDRNGERRDYDVVLPRGIIGVNTQRISGGSADLFGIELAEFSIGAGIAEIEDELVAGDFYLNRIGGCRGKADFRPGFVAHQSEAEEKDNGGGGPDGFECVAAASEVRFLAVVAKLEDGEGEAQLREDENRRGDSQSQIILMINLRADRGDSRRTDGPGQTPREKISRDSHEHYQD